jgi:hypothetical protein
MSGNQAELAALIQRLELVTSRLEKVPGGAPVKNAGKISYNDFSEFHYVKYLGSNLNSERLCHLGIKCI